MDHSSLVLLQFIVLRLIQTKKKLRNKQNRTGSTIRKLLHLRIAFGKKKRRLLELCKPLSASKRWPKKSFKKLLKYKPEKTNEKQQNKHAKLKKHKSALKKLLQSLKLLL
jgi:hypothetical protein